MDAVTKQAVESAKILACLMNIMNQLYKDFKLINNLNGLYMRKIEDCAAIVLEINQKCVQTMLDYIH